MKIIIKCPNCKDTGQVWKCDKSFGCIGFVCNECPINPLSKKNNKTQKQILPDYNIDDHDPDLAALSEKYVWSVHGRGLSTSLGIQTRRLIGEAFRSGYRAGLLKGK